MLACGTGCHMSIFVVIEQELDEKFEVAHCPGRVSSVWSRLPVSEFTMLQKWKA
jgi:hypothetical protein